jgi:hypothetical protein
MTRLKVVQIITVCAATAYTVIVAVGGYDWMIDRDSPLELKITSGLMVVGAFWWIAIDAGQTYRASLKPGRPIRYIVKDSNGVTIHEWTSTSPRYKAELQGGPEPREGYARDLDNGNTLIVFP